MFAQTSTIPVKEKTQKENTEDLAKEANPEAEAESFLNYDEASIHTRPDARTMTLNIPAPRGQIVDRFGYSFAQNKVVWYPALQMEQFADESDEFIIKWSRERIAKTEALFDTKINVTDKQLTEHYRHRRWIPMPFKHVVEKSEKDQLLKDSKLTDGIILHPLYQRLYPENSCAAHIIGYVGSVSRNLERGPINYGDPLFWELEGRGGLEKKFNKTLTGTPGKRKLQYDSFGREVRRVDIAPKPGGTVVTTIDLKWQKRAERVLRQNCKRGAFVIIDIETGEVLVMASRPSYNLNLWVPYMKPDDYDKLLKDKGKPLYARAFQATYPPASAFKVITGLAALDTGAITRTSGFNCPAHIKLGNHKFRDWSKRSRGYLRINSGLKYSNNPFFIQAALAAERKQKGRFMTVASLFGYGVRTGLPLESEASGNLLTEEYTLRRFKRGIKQGDVANASIGQGAILASPLQVAQSMAGIANNGILPQIYMIKQVQNAKGVITRANKPSDRYKSKIALKNINIIKQGMYDVVNASDGTGKRAATSYSVICGKTGTAQWGPESLNQKLAWFAGFFPLDKPKYAFAVLYEGSPHEAVSGGRLAAPMIPAFFNGLEDEAFVRHELSKKALIIPDEIPDVNPLDKPENKEPGKALIVEDITPAGDPDNALEPPKALIVEDPEDENGAGNPTVPAIPLDPTAPTEPMPTPDPSRPPKAIPVEDDPVDPDVPPLRPLPNGVQPADPEEPIDPDAPIDTPADPEPPKPPKPPKAIPVE